MKEITEAVCEQCGGELRFKIIDRPWNGQRELVVEPCGRCLDEADEHGEERASEIYNVDPEFAWT